MPMHDLICHFALKTSPAPPAQIAVLVDARARVTWFFGVLDAIGSVADFIAPENVELVFANSALVNQPARAMADPIARLQ